MTASRSVLSRSASGQMRPERHEHHGAVTEEIESEAEPRIDVVPARQTVDARQAALRKLRDRLIAGAIDLMRRVKASFDPQNLFNPGKVFYA